MTTDTATRTRKTRRAPRAERRLQLIRATIASIAELGMAETTLTSVTRRAGLSHGTINFHFQSKESLFIETLRHLADEYRDHWRTSMQTAGTEPAAQLAALLATDFSADICSAEKLAVWFAFLGEAKARPAYREICDRKDSERFREIERLCHLLKAEGGHAGVDPAMVARGLEAMLDGFWLYLLLYPDSFTRAAAQRDCLAFLGALFPRHFPAFGDATLTEVPS